MRKNGNTRFDDNYSKGLWNGEHIGNLTSPHLRRIYHYCLDYGEEEKAKEIKQELIKRGASYKK